jgi:hypothetical protein
MADIDCTLDALKVPGFSGYTPPFGTKITGSITPRDENNNILMPFGLQRPKVVTETSGTSQIQANIVFEIVAGGIVLTLGNAAFTGCRVSVINSADTDAMVEFVATPGASITARAHESVHFEWISGTWVAVQKQRIQTGITEIINRGVISGLTVGKSTTALRNISLSAGKFFMNGMPYYCPSYPNAALVPDNYGMDTRYCYAYIYFDTNAVVKFACTPFDGVVPENGMGLYRFSVPTGNSYQNDPYLDTVTITDIRRVEPAYPAQFNSIAYASVALPFAMSDSDYRVQLEILDYKGGYNQLNTINVTNKAANGFNILSEGTLDAVHVRWTALK